jgi:hypothetical protein
MFLAAMDQKESSGSINRLSGNTKANSSDNDATPDQRCVQINAKGEIESVAKEVNNKISVSPIPAIKSVPMVTTTRKENKTTK